MRWNQKSDTHKGVAESPGGWDSQTTWGRVLTTGHHLMPLATSLLMARGRFRLVDYAALGISVTNAGLSIYRVWAVEKPVDLSSYFTDLDSGWKLCGYFVSKLAFDGVEIQERIVESRHRTKGGKIVEAAYTAVIDGVEIGWVSEPDCNSTPSHIYSKTPERIRDLAAKRLWERAGSDKILRVQGEVTLSYTLPEELIETRFLQTVEKRVAAFIDGKVARAMVLDGEPGCGKTSCVGYLARKFGLKTIIIAAEEFLESYPNGHGEFFNRAMEFVEVLKPDILIVNDVDRVPRDRQLPLLEVFDNAKTYAKVIFATTNHYRDLIEPVRRPGRLDDLIRVPGLSLEEILLLAPELQDIAPKMLGWPIAYVRDMKDRYRVLGDLGLAEFDEVARRLEEVRIDGNYGEATGKPSFSATYNGAAAWEEHNLEVRRRAAHARTQMKEALPITAWAEGLM